jgi:mRNA-degrading endonuclease RelE of RelBE toxin-antitoxin system
MTYEVIPTPQFQNDIKFYKRKKKYHKITDDIKGIIESLEKGEFVGVKIEDLRLPEDESVYKVRAANADLRVGKSGGYRLVYYVIKDDKEVFLLTIFSKKDKVDVTDAEIRELIKLYCS